MHDDIYRKENEIRKAKIALAGIEVQVSQIYFLFSNIYIVFFSFFSILDDLINVEYI